MSAIGVPVEGVANVSTLRAEAAIGVTVLSTAFDVTTVHVKTDPILSTRVRSG